MLHTKLASLVFQPQLWSAKHCCQLRSLTKGILTSCSPTQASFCIKTNFKTTDCGDFQTIHHCLTPVKCTIPNLQLENSYSLYKLFWNPLLLQNVFFKQARRGSAVIEQRLTSMENACMANMSINKVFFCYPLLQPVLRT